MSKKEVTRSFHWPYLGSLNAPIVVRLSDVSIADLIVTRTYHHPSPSTRMAMRGGDGHWYEVCNEHNKTHCECGHGLLVDRYAAKLEVVYRELMAETAEELLV